MSQDPEETKRQSARRAAEFAEQLGEGLLRSLWPGDLERAVGHLERAGALYQQARDRTGEARAARRRGQAERALQVLAEAAGNARMLDSLLDQRRNGVVSDPQPPFDRPLAGLREASEQLLAARARGDYLEALVLAPVVVRWHELARRVETTWPHPPAGADEPRTAESLIAWLDGVGSPQQATVGLLAWVLGAAQAGLGREEPIDRLLAGQQQLADGVRRLAEKVSSLEDAIGMLELPPLQLPQPPAPLHPPTETPAAEAGPTDAAPPPSGSPAPEPAVRPTRWPFRLPWPGMRWPRRVSARTLGAALLLVGAVLATGWGLGAFPSGAPASSASPAASVVVARTPPAGSAAPPTATVAPRQAAAPALALAVTVTASPTAPATPPVATPSPPPTGTPTPTPADTATPTRATSTASPTVGPAPSPAASPTAVLARANPARDPGRAFVYVKESQAVADGPATQRVGNFEAMQAAGFRVVGRNQAGTALKVQPEDRGLIAGWVQAEYVALPAGLEASALPVVE